MIDVKANELQSLQHQYVVDPYLRHQAQELYKRTPPFVIDFNKQNRPKSFMYAEKEIILPELPEDAVRIVELTGALIGAYDRSDHIIGVIDFERELLNKIKSAKEDDKPVEAPDLIEFGRFEQPDVKARLAEVIKRRTEIDLMTNEDYVAAINFLSRYRINGDALAFFAGHPSYKSLDFKAFFKSRLFVRHLYQQALQENSTINHPLEPVYANLLETLGDRMLLVSNADLSFGEMEELIVNTDFLLQSSGDMPTRNLFNAFHAAYTGIVENKWLIRNYDVPGKKQLSDRLKQLQGEEINLLVRTLQFGIRELRKTIQNPKEFAKTSRFLSEMMKNFSTVLTPEFNPINISVAADLFDQIVLSQTMEDRDKLRAMITYMLINGQSRSISVEAVSFYTNYFRAIKEGKFTYDGTTVDSEMEIKRIVNAINFLNERRKQQGKPSIKTVFEVGVGTGRVLKELKKYFPDLAVYGCDILKKEVLKENGLPDDIPVMDQTSIVDITPQALEDKFGRREFDLVIAVASVLCDLDMKNIPKAFRVMAQIAQEGMTDQPLVAKGQGGYADSMTGGSNPFVQNVVFNEDTQKGFSLLSAEDWTDAIEKAGFVLLNVADKELFLTQIRMVASERTDNITNHPEWRTAVGKPRVSFIFCRKEDQKAT